jgi:hypothetical protein
VKTKVLKRREAEERQAVYDGLSAVDKWRLLRSRPGESRREGSRLLGDVQAAVGGFPQRILKGVGQ